MSGSNACGSEAGKIDVCHCQRATIRAAALAMVLAAGCSDSPAGSTPVAGKRIAVLATTGMIADAARIVGGEQADVTALMGPGVDPHLYQPTARDQTQLKAAQLVLYNGLHLEGRMVEVFESLAKKKPVVAVSQDLAHDRLLAWQTSAGMHDPHIWFDVGLWQEAVRMITAAYVRVDPTHADDYRRRSEAYIGELEQVDRYCRERAAEIPEAQRVLITSHDAFHYFGKAYGFEVVGIQGISTETEAGLKAITDAVDLIKSRRLKAIFPETSVPRAAIERVGHDSGAALGAELCSDALGAAEGPAGTYSGMIRTNIDAIVNGLKGNNPSAEGDSSPDTKK